MARPPLRDLTPQDETVAQFPEIEKLIDSEDFSKINQSLTAAYEELEKVSKARGGMGKSRDAKKAMKAIERVMDLLRELLKVKYRLSEGGAPTPQPKKS
jgi:hypothetical protein